MKRERGMELIRRMLHLLDTRTTDFAPDVMELPLDSFTSPEILAGERSEIWAKTPMFIGFSSEIREPGSFFTRDIVETPYLCLRHKDGSVRLYLNSCRHRGVKVALGSSGRAPRLVCRFHSWCYDLDGRLVGVPESEAFEGMDRATRGLIELPVAEKYGMIFGCATPGTVFDIDEVLGGLGPELEEWGFSEFKVYGEPHIHEVNGNWKFAWDTFCENYHFGSLHPVTLGPRLHSEHQAFDRYGKNLRIISAWKSIDAMRETPEETWEPKDHLSVQYRLYPAINFTVLPRFMAVYWIMPGRRPDHAQGLHITYVDDRVLSEEETASLEEAIRFGCEDVVQAEDFWMTAMAEPAMRSPAAQESFVLGRNEPALQHFHSLYREAVDGAPPRQTPKLKLASGGN